MRYSIFSVVLFTAISAGAQSLQVPEPRIAKQVYWPTAEEFKKLSPEEMQAFKTAGFKVPEGIKIPPVVIKEPEVKIEEPTVQLDKAIEKEKAQSKSPVANGRVPKRPSWGDAPQFKAD